MSSRTSETPRGWFWSGSFTGAIALRFATLVTATTALVLGAGAWLLDRQMLRSLENLHDIEFTEVVAATEGRTDLPPEQLAQRLATITDAGATLFFVQVSEGGSRILFRSRNLGDVTLPTLLSDAVHLEQPLPPIGTVYVSQYSLGSWQVQVASGLETTQRLLRDYLRVSSFLLAGIVMVSVGLGFGFARLVLRPVRAIRETASRIRGDALAERIPVPPGRDELASLVRLLNEMFDRIEASFHQMRHFSATASHELKTPLSLIRLNAERLQRQLAEDPTAQAAIGDLLEEVSRLGRLIESLLFLSKAEGHVLALDRRVVQVGEFISGFSEDARLLAEDRRGTFRLGTSDPGMARVDASLIRQLLLNLLANALSVSPPDGTVQLDSRSADGIWEVTLTDEGPGIPADLLPRIFQPFVRFEVPGRTENLHSTGLGLAICRSIAELHGGTIAAANRPDRSGLRVTVRLPVGEATAAP